MRALFFTLFLAMACGLCAQGAESHRAYIGCVARVAGVVELRESGSSKVELLSTADYRPLYEGTQIRCGTNGSAAIYLLFGASTNYNKTNCSKWTQIPRVPQPVSPQMREVQIFQATNTTLGGRTRGGSGPARRAILIGINEYEPVGNASAATSRAKWSNLNGSLNDVEIMRQILISRFAFHPDDILVLTNALASRTNILGSLESHLMAKSAAGDLAFLFYAGHGSQVRNSKAPPDDPMDETIVPADAAQGVPDIRDKELRRYVNAILNRGVQFTGIFDSCYSGSITRGEAAPQSRFLPPANSEIADGSDPGPNPRDRGALIISAAMDNQLANETTWQGRAHGAFSAALLNVLSGPSAADPVEALFLRVRAILHSDAALQQPILEANKSRQKSSLLGELIPGQGDQTLVGAGSSVANGKLVLEGGSALGLAKNSELRSMKVGGPRLRIVEVSGIARSVAEVIEGDGASIKTGDLFALDTWALTGTDPIRFWIPPAITESESKELAQMGAQISGKTKGWIHDPVAMNPTNLLRRTGNGWEVFCGTARSRVGPFLSLENLSTTARKGKFFLEVPPSENIVEALRAEFSGKMELAKTREEANYALVGHSSEGGIEYAWIMPAAYGAKTNQLAIPAQTLWVAGNSDAAAQTLGTYARRLARIHQWIQIDSPSTAEGVGFPYELGVRRLGTKKLLAIREMRKGEKYEFVLRSTAAKLRKGLSRRWVYLFLLDASGKTTCLFPREGAEESLLPRNPTELPEEISLAKIVVTPPFGVDTYILMVSQDPLPNPQALNSDGVLDLQSVRGSSPLQQLINSMHGATRGAALTGVTPRNWHIGRLQTVSRP